MPASGGRLGAPAITANPATATPIAAQVRGRTGSPASSPSSAAASGASAWITITSATGASLSAVRNEIEDTAISTVTSRPARPVARNARSTRPRSATATKTSRAANANTARPASWVATLMCSWRCKSPASDQAAADSSV